MSYQDIVNAMKSARKDKDMDFKLNSRFYRPSDDSFPTINDKPSELTYEEEVALFEQSTICLAKTAVEIQNELNTGKSLIRLSADIMVSPGIIKAIKARSRKRLNAETAEMLYRYFGDKIKK